MLQERNNNKITIETAKKISRVYGQAFFTNHQFWNWFSKFTSGNMSVRDEPKPRYSLEVDQNAFKRIGEMQSVQNYLENLHLTSI